MLARFSIATGLAVLIFASVLATSVEAQLARAAPALAGAVLAALASAGGLAVLFDLFPLREATFGLALILLGALLPDRLPRLEKQERSPVESGAVMRLVSGLGRLPVLGPVRTFLYFGGLAMMLFSTAHAAIQFGTYNTARSEALSSLRQFIDINEQQSANGSDEEARTLEERRAIEETRLKALNTAAANLEVMSRFTTEDRLVELLPAVDIILEVYERRLKELDDAPDTETER